MRSPLDRVLIPLKTRMYHQASTTRPRMTARGMPTPVRLKTKLTTNPAISRGERDHDPDKWEEWHHNQQVQDVDRVRGALVDRFGARPRTTM